MVSITAYLSRRVLFPPPPFPFKKFVSCGVFHDILSCSKFIGLLVLSSGSYCSYWTGPWKAKVLLNSRCNCFLQKMAPTDKSCVVIFNKVKVLNMHFYLMNGWNMICYSNLVSIGILNLLVYLEMLFHFYLCCSNNFCLSKWL